MPYFISFLEGVITFISPCLLPMLPLYISYFAGGTQNTDKRRTLQNALAFILGFTIVFVCMGAFAGTLGSFLQAHQTLINIITGSIVILFGLQYLGLFHLKLFSLATQTSKKPPTNALSSLLFGIVFSVGWTPCVGTFLGSALLFASSQGSVTKGIVMLLCYSLGLGIPFLISALLIDSLKGAFDSIKRHYKIINTVSGLMLVALGLLILSGKMGYFLSLLSF